MNLKYYSISRSRRKSKKRYLDILAAAADKIIYIIISKF